MSDVTKVELRKFWTNALSRENSSVDELSQSRIVVYLASSHVKVIFCHEKKSLFTKNAEIKRQRLKSLKAKVDR